MNSIYQAVKKFISYRFSLQEDSKPQLETIEAVKKNVEFKGANLWTLIFAIFIASIGLNVNSTAVIIGAMLVSPLMGPIMGLGLGIGINDFELVKKSARNVAIATVFSIATSTLYFYITPLDDASSELLSRTSPSIWDVFIAGFGGLAGIVAATRKEKGTVIPGVAIATALMPPLCTAGYGIASGNLYFFMGAIYLYFINSVFICVATYLIVRYMKFQKKEFEDKSDERRVKRYILMAVLVTAAPSVYLAYRIVDKSIFENNAKAFIQKEINNNNTQVITSTYDYNRKGNKIELLLLGDEVSKERIDTLKKRMSLYSLDKTQLNIKQGLNAKNEVDLSQIKASILETVYQRDSNQVSSVKKINRAIPDLRDELRSLYPTLQNYSIDNISIQQINTKQRDTVTLAALYFEKPISKSENLRLGKWLKSRLKTDSLKIVMLN